jgi:hypothetical protein
MLVCGKRDVLDLPENPLCEGLERERERERELEEKKGNQNPSSHPHPHPHPNIKPCAAMRCPPKIAALPDVTFRSSREIRLIITFLPIWVIGRRAHWPAGRRSDLHMEANASFPVSMPH